jgi:hypothetical protein
MAALARKYAPELRTIEACHTKDLVGAIDVWVPQLNFLHQDLQLKYQIVKVAGQTVASERDIRTALKDYSVDDTVDVLVQSIEMGKKKAFRSYSLNSLPRLEPPT